MVNPGHKQAPLRSAARLEGRVVAVLFLTLVAGLIAYKTGPALRAVHTARATGVLNLHPYLASNGGPTTPLSILMESLAYLRIIWPALVFGILIAAAARMALPPDWFTRNFNRSKARSTFSGVAVGVPLMLCSCCAAPVFEGMYARTRRLDASLALMLAAPTLNPAALVLTFMLFPVAVAAGRVALTIMVLIGIASLAMRISVPTRDVANQPFPHRYEFLPGAYARSVLHIVLRTVPFILPGTPAAILIFHRVNQMPVASGFSVGTRIVFIAAVLLLPMPTLFEIPLAYSLLLIGVPFGMVIAVLFAGPAVNLPSLLIVGRTAGLKVSLLLIVLVGGLAAATALAFPR